MGTGQDFGKMVVRFRRKAGHASAHGFFQSVGGERGLGFTYFHYLRIEQGKQLPKPDKLRPLAEALGMYRVPGRQGDLRTLLSSYFFSLLTDRHLAEVYHDTSTNHVSSSSAQARRMVDIFAKTAKNLTEREVAFLVESADRYRTFLYCTMVEKACSPQEVAAFWGVPVASVLREFEALKKRGFARKTSGLWESGDYYYRWPARSSRNTAIYELTDRIEAEVAGRAANVFFEKNAFFISNESLLKDFLPVMLDAFQQYSVHEASDPSEADGAYMLHFSMSRIVKF